MRANGAFWILRVGCILALCAGCGGAAPIGIPAVIPTPPPPALAASEAFQPYPCWGSVPADIDARCGFVTVLENRRKAAGGAVRLAVMVLQQAGNQPGGGEPTFLLGGGPGQDVISLMVALLSDYDKLRRNGFPPGEYAGQLTDWLEFRGAMDLLVDDLAKRPLVLFDQRGAGYSKPSLKCHEERYDACHERLVRSGVDLAGYNTRENAADVEAIRLALGYDRINLQGGSYGTKLALRVMRDFPEHLRAVVLDSVTPPPVDWYPAVAARWDRMMGIVLDHCAADPRCHAAYPRLRDEFYELMARLAREPAQLPGGDHLHADAFLNLVWNALYDISGIRWLPLVIHHAHEGDYAPLETLARLRYAAAGPESMSWGMNYAVECAENWSDATRQELLTAHATLHPAIADAAVGQFLPFEEICREWAVPSELPEADEAVTSAIPTLLLSGEFDPGTPPEFAAVAAATLSHHYSYVFPSLGHTDGFLSRCWSAIESQFLDDPDHAPDASCIGGMSDAVFVVE